MTEIKIKPEDILATSLTHVENPSAKLSVLERDVLQIYRLRSPGVLYHLKLHHKSICTSFCYSNMKLLFAGLVS